MTNTLPALVASVAALLGRFPPSVVQLALRFLLHLFGAEIAYPAPILMAWLSGVAEIVLPILLVFGLATRFAGLGLLVMTAIIQLTIPDGWANFHLPWAAMALAVMAYGPGRISLDHLIVRMMGGGAAAALAYRFQP